MEISLSGGEVAEKKSVGKHYAPLPAAALDASLRQHKDDRPLEAIRATLDTKLALHLKPVKTSPSSRRGSHIYSLDTPADGGKTR